MHLPLLIAHRGDTVHLPENTIEAFASAFSYGADGIECDVQFVNEKLLIVHNYLFDQTKQYPTVNEVLAAFGQKGRVEIEIKGFSDDIIAPLHDAITLYHPKDYELTTSELPLIPYIRKAFPEASIGAIYTKCFYEEWMNEALVIRKIVGLTKLLGANVSHIGHIPHEKLTKSFVDTIHNAQIKVHCHIPKTTIEEEKKTYEYLHSVGIDQCTVDDIFLMNAVE